MHRKESEEQHKPNHAVFVKAFKQAEVRLRQGRSFHSLDFHAAKIQRIAGMENVFNEICENVNKERRNGIPVLTMCCL